MALSRADILGQTSVPTEPVDVPEWGDGATVLVRCLSSKARLAWGLASQKAAAGEVAPDPTSLLVSLGAVDESGALLFSVQDSDALAELRGDVVERIAAAVMKVSGIGADAAKDAEKNSATTSSGDSVSSSPETSDAPSENSENG